MNRAMNLNESIVEDAALEWFGGLCYAVGHGLDIAPREPAAKRDSLRNIGASEAGEYISGQITFNANRKSVVKGE